MRSITVAMVSWRAQVMTLAVMTLSTVVCEEGGGIVAHLPHDVALGEDAGDLAAGVDDDDGADAVLVEERDRLGDRRDAPHGVDGAALALKDMLDLHVLVLLRGAVCAAGGEAAMERNG